jgi:hypothetical protein
MRRLYLLLAVLCMAQFSYSQILTASQGLQKVGINVRLGQNYGNPLNPAAITSNRQIPTNDYFIILTDVLSTRSTSLGGRFITQYDTFTNKTTHLLPGEADFVGEDGSARYSNSFFDMFHVASGFLVSQMQARVGEAESFFEITDQINSNPQIRLGIANSGGNALIQNNNGVMSISNGGIDGNMRFVMDFNTGRAQIANNFVDPETSGQFFQVFGSAYILDSLILPLLPEGSVDDSLVVWDENTKALRRIDRNRMPSNILQRVGVNDTDYTATSSNYLIGFTSLSTGRTVTLPAASTMTNKTIIIKDESGSAGIYNITVAGAGSETIDGVSAKMINTNFGSISIYSNGSNWFVITRSENIML